MTSSRLLIKFSYLFHFFPFIGYVNSDTIDFSGKSTCIGGGRISPGWTFPTGDILLQVGSPLEIHCSLNLTDSETKGYSAKDIMFRKGDEKVDSKYVTVMNETTVRLYVDNSTKNDTNEYYYCSLALRSESKPKSLPFDFPQTYPICRKTQHRSKEPPELVIGLNYVTPDTKKPKGVMDFTCRNYNWETLKCTWHEPDNKFKTNYSVFYQIPRKIPRNRMQYECAIREGASCTWTSRTVPPYRPFFNYLYFQIKGVNEFGENIQTAKIDNFGNVVPAAPTELVAISKTTHSIQLQCNIGVWTIFNMSMDFIVEFASISTPDWIVRRYQGNDTDRFNDIVQINVTGLNYPNMEFQFKVYMKSPMADEDCWSEPATASFKTAPCVHEVVPETYTTAFEVYSESENHRDVLVYWKPLVPEGHNGDDYDFDITVWEYGTARTDLMPVFVSCSYADFTNLSFKNYEFLIRLLSRKDSSDYTSMVYLPRKQDILPGPEVFTKVDMAEDSYHLAWKLSNTIDIDEITNVILFWCESNRAYHRPFCAGSFNWTYLSPEAREYNFTADPDVEYEFAISISSSLSSSGLSWATCDLPPNQLNEFKNIWTDEVGSTFINLRWKLECPESANWIKGYNVTYCPVKTTNLQECADLEKTLVVYGNGSVDYASINDLRPSTTYKVSAFAFSDALVGPASMDIWSYTRAEALGDTKALELTSDVVNTESVWNMMEKKIRTLKSRLSNEIICDTSINLC